jgi:hypothetical protein
MCRTTCINKIGRYKKGIRKIQQTQAAARILQRNTRRKINIYCAIPGGVLTYEAECWSVNSRDKVQFKSGMIQIPK